MNSVVIGIVSYLPDDEQIRKQRFDKLCKLLDTCNQLFNLPIYIIKQNYTEEEYYKIAAYKNVLPTDIYFKLGITGARKKLREWFINSNYDCLIMLDDDCNIIGDSSGGEQYLNILYNHPGCFGEFRGSQLKLFFIYKDVLKCVEFADINPEKGEGFEDTIFVETLRKKFPNRRFCFPYMQNLKETSKGAKDNLSTWYTNQNLKDMLDKTHAMKRSI